MGLFDWLQGRKKGVKKTNTNPVSEVGVREVDPDLQTPEGAQVVVSVGPKPEPLPKATDHFGPVEQSAATVVWKCGHVAPASFAMDMYGEVHNLKQEHLNNKEKCGECLALETKAHSIRCGKCGLVIMPGEGLAIYHDSRKLFPNRHWITHHRDSVVGCMRADCCPSGAFFFAIWNGEKIVPQFEGLSVMEETVRTGKPMCGTIGD
jgi:hypothetical protein